MTMGMQALSGLGLVYIILIFCRCILKWGDGSCGTDKRPGIGIAQTTGSRQVQADVAQIWDSSAGLMAVAADAILDRYEPYCELNDPIYFFRTSFLEASQRIQRTIGERRGGASTGAVFINRSHLYYAVAGDIRVAVMRGGEMIPLSKGQTLDVLAAQAYEDGKISRQDTLWSMEEKKVWSYLGQDGFHEIEVCEKPVLLKPEDKVLLMSKGIFEELSWREIEDILIDTDDSQKSADCLIRAAEQKGNPQRDNGSVILIQRLEA